MVSFLLWYLAVSLIGLAAFPLAFRLLPALPDRGYAFSRALGLLVWGYLFWLLASLGFAQNDLGGQFIAFLILLGLSIWALRGLSQPEIGDWWRAHRRQVIVVEVLFFGAFAAWALVRAANPDIAGTEKPMELAFINAILRSPSFPPHDPWLSGYAISYYYFGYVLVAMLAMLTGVPGSVAFNLGVSLVFALSAVGAYGIVYNLLRAFHSERKARAGDPVPGAAAGNRAALGALSGPVFVLLLGNLEGFLEVLHARGLFWIQDASGQLVSRFWTWLDIQDLSQSPAQPFSWLPTRYLWWWRASRVLQDYDLVGNSKEIIDEFPFFSYLLGDLHPHVLAMPFAFLAMAVALNLFLSGAGGRLRWFGMGLRLNPQAFALAAVVLGGLAFLNTWDFPIYLALVCGAYVLRGLTRRSAALDVEPAALRVEGGKPVPALEGLGDGIDTQAYPRSALELAKDFLRLGLALGVTGILLYLPFYLGFSSQAGGVIPNLIYVTRGAHLWVMFGAFLLPLAAFLIYLWRGSGSGITFRRGLLLAIWVALFLWVTSLLLGLLVANLPPLGDLYLDTLGARGNQAALLREALTRRIVNVGSLLTLLALVAGTLALLWPASRTRWAVQDEAEPVEVHASAGRALSNPGHPSWFLSHRFALLLLLVGALLVLGPEFYYLRDQFGYRINTIFKFYFQAWLLWGVAAAYGSAVLLRQLRRGSRALFMGGLILVAALALVYPVLSLWEKTSGFNPPGGFTLDGAAFMERRSPDEWAAIEWLRAAPPGVVVEAVGGSYSEYARAATFSGQPNVLGWPGHQSQWRGGSAEMGSRQSDVERIFRSNDWAEVQELLERYDVRYVFVGLLEQSTYRVNEAIFRRFLTPLFQQGQVTVYLVP